MIKTKRTSVTMTASALKMPSMFLLILKGLNGPDRSEENTSGEERMQTLGMVGKVLFVVYTERGENKRIISARIAEKHERRSYNGYYQIDGKGWAKAA